MSVHASRVHTPFLQGLPYVAPVLWPPLVVMLMMMALVRLSLSLCCSYAVPLQLVDFVPVPFPLHNGVIIAYGQRACERDGTVSCDKHASAAQGRLYSSRVALLGLG